MSENLRSIRVRFAPSPTGRTHLGSGRTALYNYLFAHQKGGQFILRIEDTDQKRYLPEAEQELIDCLHWLGLNWDEGPDVGGPHSPYHQSERKEIYQQFANELIERGCAYYCFCTPERLAQVRKIHQEHKQLPLYDGLCRQIDNREAQRRKDVGEPCVIRFKTPREGSITVRDHLRGGITFKNKNLDDYILVKSDGLALYHLAAMVDDHLMEISHVIRGSEWLSTLPLHAHIIRAFGWQEPVWVHLSVFLKPSGKGKMSKRDYAPTLRDGYSIYLKDLQKQGYLPEAVINWVALMGWSYDDHTEFFTLEELVEKFSLDRLNPAPAAINFTKLDRFNGLHIRNLSSEGLARRLEPFLIGAGFVVDKERLLKIIPLIQERLVTLDDIIDKAGFLFREEISPKKEELIGDNLTEAESAHFARCAYQVISALPEITGKLAEAPLRNLAEELGLKVGQLFGILRVAVTGQKVSPPLIESMEIIGKDIVLHRIKRAIDILDNMQ